MTKLWAIFMGILLGNVASSRVACTNRIEALSGQLNQLKSNVFTQEMKLIFCINCSMRMVGSK